MPNFIIYLFQFAYLIIVACILKQVVLSSIFDKYSNGFGKGLGILGGVGMIFGFDGIVGAIPSIFDPNESVVSRVHTLTNMNMGYALTIILLSCLVAWVGIGSWIFTKPEMKEIRMTDEEIRNAAEEARSGFNPAGEIVSIRKTLAKGGILSSTERFTEIETTQGIYTVDAEINNINKGTHVFMNQYGKVRIDNKIYSIRS